MRRFGLPRWARPPRPRVLKAPAPPSLLALIKEDRAWDLQQRLCAQGSAVLGEVLAPDPFWSRDWPRLVRQAAEHGSLKSLAMLAGLRDRLDHAERPLPAFTLGWLLKGMEAKGATFSGLDKSLRDALLPRLAASPIRLRAEDGLRLMRLGGYRSVFYVAGPTNEGNGFEHADAFRGAWSRWCSIPAHREAALELSAASGTLARFNTRQRSFEEVALELAGPARAALAEGLCDRLANSPQSWTSDSENIQSMGRWMHLFHRHRWPLDHPVWSTWGKRLCRSLETTVHPNLARDLLSTVLACHAHPTQPFPGWAWTPALARGLATSLSDTVLQPLRLHEQGSGFSDQKVAQLATWLREILQLEALQAGWGTQDAAGRRAFRAVLHDVLGADWEDRADALFADRPQGPEHARWSAWKAARLDLALDATPPARRGPRL